MKQIKMTETRFELVGKVTYKQVSEEVTTIDGNQYNLIISSCNAFRRLGGSETITRSYTCRGYNVVKLVSKSPSRAIKVVRQFEFN